MLFVYALLQLEFHENVLNCVRCFHINGTCTAIRKFNKQLDRLHCSLYGHWNVNSNCAQYWTQDISTPVVH